MIINRNGAKFEYKGVSFVIGQPVVGTSQSEYEGLYGLITEIRDGEDKETESDTPDIYCAFIAGSRLPSRFFVDFGAAIRLASTIVPPDIFEIIF